MHRSLALLVPVIVGCGNGSPPAQSGNDVGARPASSASEPSSVGAPDAGARSVADTAPTATTPTPPPEDPPAPKDPDDPWLSHRQIAPDVVVATIKPAAAKVSKCLNEGLKRDSTLEGEVHLRFVVTHEGKVVDFKDDNSSIADAEVTKCIGGVIKGLKFPVQASPGGAFGVYSTHLSH